MTGRDKTQAAILLNQCHLVLPPHPTPVLSSSLPHPAPLSSHTVQAISSKPVLSSSGKPTPPLLFLPSVQCLTFSSPGGHSVSVACSPLPLVSMPGSLTVFLAFHLPIPVCISWLLCPSRAGSRSDSLSLFPVMTPLPFTIGTNEYSYL